MSKQNKQAQGNNAKEQPKKRVKRENVTVLTTEACVRDIILTTALISQKKLTPGQAIERLSIFPPDLQIMILATCEAVATCGK